LQAGLTLHRRGHKVVLIEEKENLGGQFSLASIPPSKKRIGQPLHSLISQVQRAGIEVRVSERATRETLDALAPDVVVLATGSRPAGPAIDGLGDTVSVEDVLEGTRDPGDRVLVVGGGMVGVEVAEFLAKRGKDVAVVEVLDEIASDMEPVSRKLLSKRLAGLPVQVHTATQVARFEGRRAIVAHERIERDLGEFDGVVIAVGNQPYDPLSEQLAGASYEVRTAGDAEQVGNAGGAIRSGHAAGLAI
jgi:NADPH-dependent 2,4-dienoyl-CoA reductase/sulfur reductase-like enzyme